MNKREKIDLSNLCGDGLWWMGRKVKVDPSIDRSKAGPVFGPIKYEDEEDVEEIKPSLLTRLKACFSKK